MSNSAELLAAITELQAATNSLTEARDALNGHNTDTSSHPDLREVLETLLHGETVYTKDQILEIVSGGITDHTNAIIQVAHPGWDDFEADLNEKYTSLTSRITSLEHAISGGGGGGAATDLEKEIQAIEDKYAPILDNLQSALTAAKEAGQMELVDEYKKAIETTLAEKTAEIMQAIEKYST